MPDADPVTEREAIEAILDQWKTGWEALHAGSASPTDPPAATAVPWTTRNEQFDTDGLTSWVRIAIIHTTADQTTVGSAPNRKFERRGNVFVHLFAPVDAGYGTLADYADDVRTVLEGKRLDGLLLYAARTEEQPTDGTWAMATVVIPFVYVDTR